MNFAIFDSLLDAAIVVDGEARLHYGNLMASQLFELSQRRLASQKPLLDFVQFEDQQFFAHAQLKELNGPTPYREMSFINKSGQKGWVQISAQPIAAEAGACGPAEAFYLVFLRDVSMEQNLARKYKAELEQKEQVIVDLQKAQIELENYSKNLERMVAERTRELSEANRLLKAILDSLGQGFLVFSRDGVCLPIYSRVCQEILETKPAGQPIEEVLRVPAYESNNFRLWRETLFNEPIPFEDLAPLGPTLFAHSQNWRVELEYFPLRDEHNTLAGAVVVASNKTEEFKAREEAERERKQVELILKIVRSKRQILAFRAEAERLLTQLACELDRKTKGVAIDHHKLAHLLHTLKGGAGSFAMQELHDLAHKSEDVLATLVREHGAQALGQAKIEPLSALVARMGSELGQYFSRYAFLIGQTSESTVRRVEVPVDELEKLVPALAAPLNGQVADWLLEPIELQFLHYQDLVQELARNQIKSVEPLRIQGGDLRIYPEYYQDLTASLVHLFKNAIDHGLESPDEREQQGKAAAGRISLSCQALGGQRLQLIIQDDGRGIDPNLIRQKLRRLNKNTNENEGDEQVIDHIFDDDFSTREEVTEVSGRGVGLAAVREAVRELGGEISVSSQVGVGTRFTLDLPLVTEPIRQSRKSAA